MKCLVCQKEYDDQQYGNCPYCKFPAIHVIGDADEQSEEIKEMIREYKEKMITFQKVSLAVYEWRMGYDGKVEMAKKYYIPFKNEKEFGKISWLDQKFARMQKDSVDVCIAIERSDGSVEEQMINIPVPKGKEFWCVGASFYESGQMKLHVYTQDQTTESGFISLQ